jgi:hypothetical protein
MAGVAAALDRGPDDGVRLIVETLVGAFERHRAVILAMIDASPAGTMANVLPSIEADLYALATVLPRRHRPDAPAEQLDAIVFLSMGVLVTTCVRIALQRPAHLSRDALIDLATAMVLAGFREPPSEPPGSREPPGDLAGRPGDLAGRPGDLAGRPGGTAARPGGTAGRPGDTAGRPGDTAGRPGGTAGRPGGTAGPGAR